MTLTITITRRPGHPRYPFSTVTSNDPFHTIHTTDGVLRTLTRNLTKAHTDMIYYRLEMSKTKPTQFRISVVADASDIQKTQDIENFAWLGTFRTPEELAAALEPYLYMEEGK